MNEDIVKAPAIAPILLLSPDSGSDFTSNG